MFNTAAKKGKALILMLPSPVVADELQVIPQRWSGTDPVMLIEVLGCEPWHHDSFLARDVMSEEFQPTSIIFIGIMRLSKSSSDFWEASETP